ncbi:hypothetical protein SDC9_62953 [bioreactor metagenome]|uniref:Uncharacterized protein n=1 Tax=bioreactor metagenome TaxID=1076179 RepID=A0A644XK54_9ZZZZ
MNLVNEKAKHIKFGTGVIKSNENGIVRILFDEEEFGEKAFIYPAAFETFLKLINPILDESVQDELRQIIPEKERKIREAERLKEGVRKAKQVMEKERLKKKAALAKAAKIAKKEKMEKDINL